MGGRHSEPREPVPSSQRLFLIVDRLSAKPMTLTEVARETDLPKSTVLRFLKILEEGEWVYRDQAGVYSLGAAIAGLVARYLSAEPLVGAATPPMRSLRAALDETISLSRRAGLSRVCVQEFPSTQNLRLVLGLGEQGPLHAGASGLLLFAHMPPEERARLADVGFARYTSRTITSLGELEVEAERIRAQGWAMTRGQRTEGGLAIAVPVFGPSGEVAALGVFGPEIRCSTKREQERWRRELLATAAEINEATLGRAAPGSTA